MKKVIVSLLAVSTFSVGCGQAKEPAVTGPLKPQTWVALYSDTRPTVYYVATSKTVKSVGTLLARFKHVTSSLGPGGWASDVTGNNLVEVHAIPGINMSKAVAIKFTANGLFYEALPQSKKP